MNKLRKKLLFQVLVLANLGIMVFIFAGSIAEWYYSSKLSINPSVANFALVLGLMGFILTDFGVHLT